MKRIAVALAVGVTSLLFAVSASAQYVVVNPSYGHGGGYYRPAYVSPGYQSFGPSYGHQHGHSHGYSYAPSYGYARPNYGYSVPVYGYPGYGYGRQSYGSGFNQGYARPSLSFGFTIR